MSGKPVPILVRDLVIELGGKLEHGAIVRGLRSVGDLDVEISVSIKRRVSHADGDFYTDESLALLLAGPRTCDHTKQNRSRYTISKTSRCGGNIAGVIVYQRTTPWPYLPFGQQGAQGRMFGYDFVCAVHLRHHRHAASDVIDTIEFTKAARDRIRKAKVRHDEKWNAECRERDRIDDENERRAKQGLPPLEGGWRR